MKKIAILILVMFLFIGIKVSGVSSQDSDADKKQSFYVWGYHYGYESGKREKAQGHECKPEVMFEQPWVQPALNTLRGLVGFRSEFDQAFKDGFFAGVKDGYHGHPKKYMNEENEE